MSAITIDNELVHYEVLGRGRPVILVHGWLGSWRYWVPAMQHLSMKYRVYALDLWGFGDSARNPSRYDFAAQVELVAGFMSRLGIVRRAGRARPGAAISGSPGRQHPTRARAADVCPPLCELRAPADAPRRMLCRSPPAAPRPRPRRRRELRGAGQTARAMASAPGAAPAAPHGAAHLRGRARPCAARPLRAWSPHDRLNCSSQHWRPDERTLRVEWSGRPLASRQPQPRLVDTLAICAR